MGGGKGPETPPPRDYYKETMDTLTAQVKMAPSLYAAEAAYTPKMERVALAGYRNTLLGRTTVDMLSDQSKSEYNAAMAEYNGAAGQVTELKAKRAQVAAGTWQGGDNRGTAAVFGLAGFGHGGSRVVDTKTLEEIDTEINRLNLVAQAPPDPAAFSDRGLMDILEKDIMPAMSRSENATNLAQRTADIQSVELLGNRASEAYLNADPRSKGLLEEINRQSLAALKTEGALTDQQSRYATQVARQGMNARGLTLGNQGIGAEVLSTYQLTEQRKMANYQNAQATLGLNKAFTADPFQAILGRQGQAFGAGVGQQQFASGFASNIGPKTFSPENQYAADMANSNQQTAAAYASARAQVQSATIGAIGSAIGGAASGGFSMLGNQSLAAAIKGR